MKLGTTWVTLAFAVVVMALYPSEGLALMNSTNFTIWADSISSGGNRSSSTNFISTDTLGEAATGEDQASANFFVEAGLPAIFAEPVVTMSLSASSISFSPNISPSAVSTASYTMTVATNAQFGYTARISESGSFSSGVNDINDVTDGAVSAGSEEYGIAVSGVDVAFANDQAIPATSLVTASRSNWITSSVTTVTHKAAVPTGFPAATYSHTVTHVVIGNF